MKSCFILILSLCFVCLTGSAQRKHSQSAKDKLEDNVFDHVAAVPEVKKFLNLADDPQSKHVLIIDEEPHGELKYYVVKMGYDGDMFRTVERFCVDPKTFVVYYWDTLADDAGFSYSAIISLKKWREYRNTALWHKPHTYKAGKLVALKE